VIPREIEMDNKIKTKKIAVISTFLLKFVIFLIKIDFFSFIINKQILLIFINNYEKSILDRYSPPQKVSIPLSFFPYSPQRHKTDPTKVLSS